MVHGRWHGTIALWTNKLRAYEGKSLELIPQGPRSRESVHASWYTTNHENSSRSRIGHKFVDSVKQRPNEPRHACSISVRSNRTTTRSWLFFHRDTTKCLYGIRTNMPGYEHTCRHSNKSSTETRANRPVYHEFMHIRCRRKYGVRSRT